MGMYRCTETGRGRGVIIGDNAMCVGGGGRGGIMY